MFCVLFCQALNAIGSKHIFEKYPNKHFIETGSYEGEGIQFAIDSNFKNIYSIELSNFYYKQCCNRFAPYHFVNIFLGDSTEVLPIILKEIDAPATFWLDGHYSGPPTVKGQCNTPLLAELEHISQHPIKTHTILIDDARLFGTSQFDFISVETIIEKIRLINPNYEFFFEDGYVPKDILVAIVRN
jgi:hypothetical protein